MAWWHDLTAKQRKMRDLAMERRSVARYCRVHQQLKQYQIELLPHDYSTIPALEYLSARQRRQALQRLKG
jgi:hypothetical protein